MLFRSMDGDGCNADCTIGNNNGCPATSPYKNPATGACVSTCPAGYYNDPTTFSCLSCDYTCATCSTPTTCNSCSAASHRVLTNSTCPPAPGYYDNGTTNAVLCVTPCSTCSSASVCLTCLTGFYLSSASCFPCSTNVANCTRCDATGTTCSQC